MAESLELLQLACSAMRRETPGPAAWCDSWLTLQCLCPDALTGAAEILDTKAITKVVARQSRRSYHLVEGMQRNKNYACVPGFCSCMSWCMTVATVRAPRW